MNVAKGWLEASNRHLSVDKQHLMLVSGSTYIEHVTQKQMACHFLNDPGTNDSSQNFTLLLLTQWNPKDASM
jgi:hypothetical protein